MVRAQFKLLVHLGISKLFVSVGSSMGGMQSIVTTCLEPQRVQRVVTISGCGITGPSSIALQYSQWSVDFFSSSHLTPNEKLCHSALIIFDSTTPDHCYQSNCHLIRKSFSTPSFPNLQHPQKRLSSLIVEVLAKEEEEDDDAGVGVGVVVGDNGDDNLPGQQKHRRHVRSGMSDKSISVSTKY
ncbi:hypothetical protein PPACK8108_LOCUS13014 [Phakopsora pachyrhizi]|uniref:AB hydrolase-1 domain-containing protein n=1 Tax=Phakopsora pachyrhizi TaxID=170000 RepID=A0AAV0B4V2_PHAPC|nr:hypothetical protein PPACK8108_LOCUS13014 [Phakopsora pachyrhizi]